ncbi:methionyl-tRNA formyltransferase [Duncaniella muricolitica]|jgi:methionyl-tRNA formyltransferase|uniref:methionyl-tRNA formyltransferase n=1 Tax=Duncaniella muricolitica TaxID=2880704 RepID=UPI00244DF2D0|nr:methionyl-tRNA formyltransferase [Duncaniella muricolitica]
MTKENLRIVFLGTPDFAVESLEAILANGYNVVGVVTMPDKPAGRGHKMYQSPVKLCAMSHGIEVLQPVRLKDPEFVDRLRALEADLFIVIAFRMLPEVVWTMPRLGTFNLHASLLPRYRGAAPINRAVMNGDTETGVTTFFLKHEIDTGDIISQERVEILPTDNVGDVHDRLMHLGAKLTVKTIDDIIAGTLRPIPQDQLIGDTEPTPAPKIFKEDCEICWNSPAETIHNHVRGLSPYPAAWSTLISDDTEQGAVKIFETAILHDMAPLAPGEIAIQGDTLIVGTATAPVSILSLQAPGKRRVTTAEYLRGARLVTPRFKV